MQLPIATMGANMEIVKMGLYVFFPLACFYYMGLPEFHEKYIKPKAVWLVFECCLTIHRLKCSLKETPRYE
jgi:hypothetical protein